MIKQLFFNEKFIGNIFIAKSYFSRLRGWIATNGGGIFQGILIPNCRSIHTFFMRYPIDVIYLNSQLKILKIVKALQPYRLSWGPVESLDTLELLANQADVFGLKNGDSLGWED